MHFGIFMKTANSYSEKCYFIFCFCRIYKDTVKKQKLIKHIVLYDGKVQDPPHSCWITQRHTEWFEATHTLTFASGLLLFLMLRSWNSCIARKELQSRIRAGTNSRTVDRLLSACVRDSLPFWLPCPRHESEWMHRNDLCSSAVV